MFLNAAASSTRRLAREGPEQEKLEVQNKRLKRDLKSVEGVV